MSYLIENRHIGVKRCKHGIFAYNRNDTFIGKSLDLYGEWCEFEIDLLRHIIKPGDTVVDVGANIGTHAVAFANLIGPAGRVVAFEPQLELFNLLTTNITLNALDRVVSACRMAVSDEERPMRVAKLPPPDMAFNFGAMPLSPGCESIDATSLDATGIGPTSLIKIDVEGMEAEVIAGARKLIDRDRPTLFVENNGNDSKAIWGALQEIGYSGYWVIGRYFNPTNFFGCQSSPWDVNTVPSSNILAFPVAEGMKIRGLEPLMGPEDNWRAASRRVFHAETQDVYRRP